jgi:tripartite-type tricarboxylate transporter receptor subunit TctC
MRRRELLRLTAGAIASSVLPRVASAESYPSRPARIIVGFAPGGGQDLIARLIGQGLSERLGQQFVVENRPGSGTIAAIETVVSARPDGHTLLLMTAAAAINPGLYAKLKYDFARDIAPVWGLIRETSVLVTHPSFPATTVPDLIAYAKARPGTVNMASSGTGATAHMAGELFKMLTGVKFTHVPYRGTAPALTDVIAGQVQLMFSSLAGSIEYIKANKLRAVAVTTTKRSTVLPDVPSISEFVPGYESSGWTGIGAPKNTPRDIIDTLNSEIRAALAGPTAQARFETLGSTEIDLSPEELGKFVADETEKWRKVIRAANIKPE